MSYSVNWTVHTWSSRSRALLRKLKSAIFCKSNWRRLNPKTSRVTSSRWVLSKTAQMRLLKSFMSLCRRRLDRTSKLLQSKRISKRSTWNLLSKKRDKFQRWTNKSKIWKRSNKFRSRQPMKKVAMMMTRRWKIPMLKIWQEFKITTQMKKWNLEMMIRAQI